MRGSFRRRRLSVHPSNPLLPVGRHFVIRQGVRSCYGFVHHPYGRIERLCRPDGVHEFRDAEEAIEAIGWGVLRRQPDPAVREALRRLVSGPGPRWEVGEDDIWVAAGRLAEVA